MSHTPRFAIGDRFRIPTSTPGHDRHAPTDVFQVEKVFTGADARTTTYIVNSPPPKGRGFSLPT